MANKTGDETPESPEVQEQYVRDELDQELVTHEGERRKPPAQGKTNGGRHLGALEDETVPVTPPMAGPADLVGEEDVDGQGNESGKTRRGEEMLDPGDELTPG